MLLSYKQVATQLGLSVSKVHALVAAGQFPRPLHLGRSARFLESEIINWVQARAAERTPNKELTS